MIFMLLNVILMDATLFLCAEEGRMCTKMIKFVLRNFELGMPGKKDFFSFCMTSFIDHFYLPCFKPSSSGPELFCVLNNVIFFGWFDRGDISVLTSRNRRLDSHLIN
jgi:hypothetical protein